MPEREIPGLLIEGGQFLTFLARVERLEEPFFILVDASEARCIFSPRIFSILQSRYEMRPAGRMTRGGQSEDWYHLRIRLGTVVKNHVPTIFRELPTYPSSDGVLGMNWFRLVEPQVKKITLDFENQKLGLDFA